MPYKFDNIIEILKQVFLNIAEKRQPSSSGKVALLMDVYDSLLSSQVHENLIPLRVNSSLEADIKTFEEKIQSSCDCSFLKSALSYFISEIVCNVEQHAGVEQGLGFAFFDQSQNTLLVGIADAGVSIYGSYVKNQKYLTELGDSDAQALYLAQNGYSTKNLPNAENRGYGISSNSKMMVEGLGGTFSILSGNALFYHSADGKRIVDLPETIDWPGTMVLAEIPLTAKPINIYNYIS